MGCGLRAHVNRSILTAILVSLLMDCGRHHSGNAAVVFRSWFLNPDQTRAEQLLDLDLSYRQIDSLVALQRTGAPTGASTHSLRDIDSIPYTLGVYASPTPLPDTGCPLIVYLHGGIGTLKNTKGEKAWEMLRPLVDSFPLLLASPSANRSAPWWSAAGLERILQTVRFMTLHYRVDRDRIFLAGVSDGATGCYAAANTICTPFAGFFAISGFGGILPRLGLPLYPRNLRQRPIYNVNAGQDRLYPAEQVNRFLDWLADHGVEVRRRMYDSEQHGFDYRHKEWDTLTDLIRTWQRPQRSDISWQILQSFPNRADNLLDWKRTADRAAIAAYWHQDSLVIRTDGLRSASLFTDKGYDRIHVRESDGGLRATVPLQKPGPREALLLMQHSCYPHAADVRMMRLSF